MEGNPLILQFIAFLTHEQEQHPRHLLLLARYHKQKHVPVFIDFLCLVLEGGNINTKKQVHYPRFFQLVKQMLFSADILLTLLLITKIFPSLSKAMRNDIGKQILNRGYKQYLKPPGTSMKGFKISNRALMDVKNQLQKIVKWAEELGYFEFYFMVLNSLPEHVKEDINAFTLQCICEEEAVFSDEQYEIFGKEILTECQKLSKRNYRLQTVECLYIWMYEELKKGYIDENQSSQSIEASETLSKIIALNNIMVNVILIQAMNKTIHGSNICLLETFMALIDELMVTGNLQTALQTTSTILPSVFKKLIKKQFKIQMDSSVFHFQLWKKALEKRNISSKLLICLNLWLPLLYEGQKINRNDFSEKMQLYRAQLLKLFKESKFNRFKDTFEETQLKKIEQIYEELRPYHSKIEQLEESSHKSRQAASYHCGDSKMSFDFNVSEESGKSQIGSILQSLRSNKSSEKGFAITINQEQLKIYSKRHSLNEPINSSLSFSEDISGILNILQMFDDKPTLLSSYLTSSKHSQPLSYIENVQFLPLMSTNSEQQSLNKNRNFSVELDRYGLKNRGSVKTKQINPNFIAIRSPYKKKIAKNRGIIVKNSVLELDYMMDSLNFRRRLILYVTFFKPLVHVSLLLKEKSIKCWKKVDINFQMPKVNQQFKSIIEIEKIKLYQIENVVNSQRFIKPNVEIFIIDFNEDFQNEAYQIPLYLHNIAEWMTIEENQTKLFDEEPELSSKWHPICSNIRKNKEEQLKLYFPALKLDKKGNVCLKFSFLHEMVLAKVFMVQDRIRVILINSNSETIMKALLEMVCSPQKQA